MRAGSIRMSFAREKNISEDSVEAQWRVPNLTAWNAGKIRHVPIGQLDLSRLPRLEVDPAETEA